MFKIWILLHKTKSICPFVSSKFFIFRPLSYRQGQTEGSVFCFLSLCVFFYTQTLEQDKASNASTVCYHSEIRPTHTQTGSRTNFKLGSSTEDLKTFYTGNTCFPQASHTEWRFLDSTRQVIKMELHCSMSVVQTGLALILVIICLIK